MSEKLPHNAMNPGASRSPATGGLNELSRTISTGTGSTFVESDEACRPDSSPVKHATIVDIDTSSLNPFESLTFQRPSIQDLTKTRGPSKIMKDTKPHKAQIRWVHLRANCMAWVEDLMDKICEERGILAEHDTAGATKNPFLRQDLWSSLYHGKASQHVHSRFMKPTCSPFSINMDDESSDSNGTPRRSMQNLVLYLPYLHWEQHSAWKQRQQLLQAVSGHQILMPQSDRDVVRQYLHHKSPLHDRRSLHQAYYYNLSKTETLGDGQVMQRFTGDQGRRPDAKMIVVDQLWLWIIRGTAINDDGESEPDLVITAFPERFNGAEDPANVLKGVVAHLQRGLEPPLKSANDLVAMIVEHCTGVFFQRQLGDELWFLEFFASAIGSVRKRQSSAFNEFCSTSRDLTELEARNASPTEVSEKLDEIFSIEAETDLTAEIKSIMDELHCIDFLSGQQQDVLSSLTRAQKSRNFSSRSLRHVCEMVKERRDAWAGVEQTARQTYSELRDQMDLKQKQVNVFEARFSRSQAEASARHGRIMLLFTIVTIIFLPMSFLTSFFGMNAKSINDGRLGLGFIAAIVFPISVGITLVALAVAFSERLRNFIVELVYGIIDLGLGVTGINRSRRRRRWESGRWRAQELTRGRRALDV